MCYSNRCPFEGSGTMFACTLQIIHTVLRFLELCQRRLSSRRRLRIVCFGAATSSSEPEKHSSSLNIRNVVVREKGWISGSEDSVAAPTFIYSGGRSLHSDLRWTNETGLAGLLSSGGATNMAAFIQIFV